MHDGQRNSQNSQMLKSTQWVPLSHARRAGATPFLANFKILQKHLNVEAAFSCSLSLNNSSHMPPANISNRLRNFSWLTSPPRGGLNMRGKIENNFHLRAL